MDSNKENKIGTRRLAVIGSRIPLPKAPLPKLPKLLLEKKEERLPLRNINQIKNTITIFVDKKCPLKIDTSNVTVRRKDLNRDFKIFKDDMNEPPLPDAGPSGKDVKITPLESPLAINGTKNVKRCLKRPHSRELLGLTPEPTEKKEENFKRRRLEFKNVDTSCMSYMKCLTQDYNTDVVTYLLEAERRSAVPKLDSQSRACVINWIIKVNGNQGNPAVVQAAISFMDAFLAMRQVDVERLQLAAAACFWLAQKNLGSCMSARELVEASDRAFYVSELAHAERTIIRLLKFPPTPVVPQDFISYLSWSCGISKPEEVEVAATFICVSVLLVDKSILCNEYPSVIAAAAVRNAVLCLGGCLRKLRVNAVYNIVESKALDFCYVCWAQQKAVCKIATPEWKFKAPLEKYSTPPQFVAHRIVSAAAEMQDIKFENMYSNTPYY